MIRFLQILVLFLSTIRKGDCAIIINQNNSLTNKPIHHVLQVKNDPTSLNSILNRHADKKEWGISATDSFQKSIKQRGEEDCVDVTLATYAKFITAMYSEFKAVQMRIIVDERLLKQSKLSSFLHASFSQKMPKEWIEVYRLNETNFYNIKQEIIAEIWNENKKKVNLNIILAMRDITEIFLYARATRVLTSKNDIWLIPESGMSKTHVAPPKTYVFKDFPCSWRLSDLQTLTSIHRVTKEGFKPAYNVHLRKNGSLEFDSNALFTQQHVIPIVSIFSPPFLFIPRKEEVQSTKEEYNIKGKIKCRVSYDDARGDNKTEHKWHTKYCFGYTVDLLLEISDALQFKIDLYVYANETVGHYDEEKGNYTGGIIGEVVNGNAIIGAGALTITRRRMKFVDFTLPFIRDEIKILTLDETAKDDTPNEFNLFSNLAQNTQYLILAFYLASILFVYVAENYLQLMKRIFTNDHKYIGVRMINYVFRDCVVYITGLLVQRDLGARNPGTFGGRLISIVFAFGMVCITTLYTASLTYQQVILRGGYGGFKGLKDQRLQHPTPEFKLATQTGAFLSDLFVASEDPILHRLNTFMKEYNTKSISTGINELLDRNLQAFFLENALARYYITQQGKCNIVAHQTQLPDSYYGLALPKNSPMTEQISQVIVKLGEDGTLTRLYKNWIHRDCTTPFWKTSEKLTIEFFQKLFTILAVAVLVALAMFVSEWTLLGLSKTHDFECMYRSSELQGMLEQDKELRKWLIPPSEQLRRKYMATTLSPGTKWRVVVNNHIIHTDKQNDAGDA